MSGKIRLDLQQIELAAVVQRTIESAEPVASTKEIRLTTLIDPTPSHVSGDPARLQQVLWNLLSNAIKFTPKGGRVQVLLQRVNSHVELSVSDTGIGIPASFLPHVFDRFSQRESSTTRSYGGLGLGLAITKQLVELHGGTIRAASAGEGSGRLSASSCRCPSCSARSNRRERDHPTRSDWQTENLELPSLAGVHVVVIDDEPDARELLARVLQEQAATVTTFGSAEEALDAMATMQPSVIVSDIGMPRMDGYQFMRSLRAGEAAGVRIPRWRSPHSPGRRIASALCWPATRRTWPSRSTSPSSCCCWPTWSTAASACRFGRQWTHEPAETKQHPDRWHRTRDDDLRARLRLRPEHVALPGAGVQ